ncbi:MAG: 2OG-Fe(II) oxygenase [Chitinophagaceae bacterium]|nr:2OG-Fe(II) oxygenase [Chitinophagaceae bacterium]
MNQQFDLLINTYLKNEIGIAPNFLTPELSLGLQQNIIQLQKDKLLTVSTIGNHDIKDANQKMRSDKIYWLDKNHNNTFENQFLHQAQSFIDYLNTTCYTGINAYEFHYAVYEPDNFYKRHKDQFKTNSNRKFTLITYLNENWVKEDGGQLQVYINETMQQILPQSQKAIFFKSNETEHEVIKTSRTRMSISGWLKCV